MDSSTSFTLRSADNSLGGRLALVTGASGGIGSQCARALAAEGCDVAIHYSASAGAAETLAKELREKHPAQTFATVQADLRSREATRNLVANVLGHADFSPRHKAVSVFIANAGIGRRIRDIKDIGEDDWDEIMEVNVRSQFIVTKAAVAGMRAQGWGRVILVGSISSRGGGLNGCHYAATKGAISSMGLNLATVLAPEGISVNIVSPAMIGSTGMIPSAKSQIWTGKETLEQVRETDPGLAIAASVPIHRLGVPEEVSNAVVMFAKSGYITGQDILVAGGLK